MGVLAPTICAALRSRRASPITTGRHHSYTAPTPSALTMISGPIPAASPMVIPTIGVAIKRSSVRELPGTVSAWTGSRTRPLWSRWPAAGAARLRNVALGKERVGRDLDALGPGLGAELACLLPRHRRLAAHHRQHRSLPGHEPTHRGRRLQAERGRQMAREPSRSHPDD